MVYSKSNLILYCRIMHGISLNYDKLKIMLAQHITFTAYHLCDKMKTDSSRHA